MPSFQKIVILFTRFPIAGKCKTRLIPTLGAERATRIHRQLVSHVLHEIKTFISSTYSTEFIIYYDGSSSLQMKNWLGKTFSYKQQQGDNLGDRMAHALIDSLNNKQHPILIGSDCPGIDNAILKNSFDALEHNDVVLGPAHDGGYYLIGVNRNMKPAVCKKLFECIPWGTDHVLSQTIAQIQKLTLRQHLLPKLHDIDTADDLKHFNYRSHAE